MNMQPVLLAALLWAAMGTVVATAADAGANAAEPASAPAADAPKEVQPSPPADKPADKPAAKAASKPADKPQEESAKGEPDPAIMSTMAEEDRDFALMGEYVGPMKAAGRKYRAVAIQVRPMGNGLFEAVQYLGGLPGETKPQPPITLIGKRHDDSLVLSGGPWAAFVEPTDCVLINRQGQEMGRLERVIRESATLGAAPPKNAIVLFDGTNTEKFTNGRITEEGLLMQGADVKPMFQDFDLHLEFLLPYMPAGRDQGRGNSGVYLQSRYEVQVLDSFAEPPTFNGCGSLYRFREPDVNMCLPPLQWQTYDIAFTAPRWNSDGTKASNARVTVWLNGVVVQDNVELPDKTGAGQPEEPTLLPIRLQDHGNPVRFRNIWLVDRGAGPAGRFPVFVPSEEDQEPAIRPSRMKPGKRNQPKPPAAEEAEPAQSDEA